MTKITIIITYWVIRLFEKTKTSNNIIENILKGNLDLKEQQETKIAKIIHFYLTWTFLVFMDCSETWLSMTDYIFKFSWYIHHFVIWGVNLSKQFLEC